MPELLLVAVTWLCFLASFLALLLPWLPAVPLLLAGMLFYGHTHAWQGLTGVFWLITGVILASGWLASYAVNIRSARDRPQTGWLVLAGMLLGPLLLGPIGVLAGPVGLVLLSELLRGADWRAALRASIRALGGVVLGQLLQLLSFWLAIAWFWRNTRL